MSGDWNASLKGLKAFPVEDRPPVNLTFQAYHLMVWIGLALILLSFLGIFFWRRGTLFEKRGLLRIFVFAVLGPQIANQLGWITAEVGRQPWIVYGLMRTSEGISAGVRPHQVFSSIVMFSAVYLLLFALFIFILDQKIRKGPAEEMVPPAGQRA